MTVPKGHFPLEIEVKGIHNKSAGDSMRADYGLFLLMIYFHPILNQPYLTISVLQFCYTIHPIYLN